MSGNKLPRGFKLRDNGSYEYRFTVDGKRYSVYGKTITACEKLAMEKKYPEAKVKGIPTLAQYFAEWDESRIGIVKESTRYCNDTRWKRIKPHLGSVPINEIERRDVIALQKLLSKNLMTAGVNETIGLLSQIMKSAVVDKLRQDNPCEGVKPLKRTEPHSTETNHRALTKKETSLFMQYAADTWYYELYQFLLMTGCRIGEAAALTWSDIDFKKKTIQISKGVSRSATGNEISTPKTSTSKRKLFVSDNVLDVLKEQRKKSKGERVFVTKRNDFIKPSNTSPCINAVIKKIEAETGEPFEHFSIHAFRDTFATRAIESGMKPKTLQKYLGHSSFKITMDLYTHVMDDTMAEEIKMVDVGL